MADNGSEPVPSAFQARVPTRLIDRGQLGGKKRDVRLIGNDVVALLRVGPFDVIRGLVRAPGLWLVEARGPNGEAVLMQLVHIRAAHDERDALERRHVENRIAKATAALFVEMDLPILAHGGADREDQSRLLFWAMPWRPDAERIVGAAMYVKDVEHLLRLGVDLALRLATRHVLGGFEPNICEHSVVVTEDGAELIGVPVHVDPKWLAAEMPTPRIAPEEVRDGRPTKSGDLWRLGHALIGLAPDFDGLPATLRDLIQRLASADPNRRPPRATDVIVELEAIHADLSPSEPPLVPPLDGAATGPLDAQSIADMIASSIGADTRVEQTIIPGERTLEDLPPVVVEDQEDTIDAVPPWAFFFRPSELEEFLDCVKTDLDRRELRHDFGTGVVQIATPAGGAFRYLGLVDLARTCHRSPRDKWQSLISDDFDGLLEATARDPDVGTPIEFDIVPAPLASTVGRRDSLDHVLEPVPIIVGNRMSEQAKAALPFSDEPAEPTQPGRVDTFDSEPTAAMSPVPGPERETPPPVPPLAVDAPLITGTGLPTLGPELKAVATNRPQRMAVLGAFIVLLLVGGGAWGYQNRDTIVGLFETPPPPPATLRATAANRVRVEAKPAGTVVVSERDGRILGPTPLSLVVPPGHDFKVLVAAAKHEPQRLVLPDRGTISTRLAKLPPDASTCAIDLPPEDVERFEGVGADLAWGDRLAVRGAAVVRVRDGRAERGAWLVRCPNFGGGDRVELVRPAPETVTIELTAPVGVEVSIDGNRVGTIPLTYESDRAFGNVVFEEGERRTQVWIPTSHPATFALSAQEETYEKDSASAASNGRP